MIGIHISKKSKPFNEIELEYKNMEDAIEIEADILNSNTTQIFTHGPRNRKQNHINFEKVKQINAIKNIYIHSSYISSGIWSGSNGSIIHIKDQLNAGYKLNSAGLILHVPKKEPRAIAETMRFLSKEITAGDGGIYSVPIILEPPAMKRDEKTTYETPEKMNKLCEVLENDAEITCDWGFCIDTAHLWSGAVDLSKNNAWNSWIAGLSESTSRRIKLLHLNGASKTTFGTGADKHIIPLSKEDDIWGGLISDNLRVLIASKYKDYLTKASKPSKKLEQNVYVWRDIDLSVLLSEEEINNIKESSLYSILNFAKKNKINIICEMNRGSFQDLKLFMDFANNVLAF